jgi:hypothetical protein
MDTNDSRDIHRSEFAILDEINLSKSIRLLGASLSCLGKDDGQTLLLQEEDREKKATLAKAADTINDTFGEHTITFASTITQEKGPG